MQHKPSLRDGSVVTGIETERLVLRLVSHKYVSMSPKTFRAQGPFNVGRRSANPVAIGLLTTIAVGTAGVKVLFTRSRRAESETSPFGVTGQEQQEIICSSGEKA